MSQGASETLKINLRSQFRKADVYLGKMKVLQIVTSKYKAQAFWRLEISVGLLSPVGTTIQKSQDRASRAWLDLFSTPKRYQF